MLLKPYVSEEQLEGLKKYQYRSAGRTTMDRLFNSWWEFVSCLVPVNVSPNILTILGFVCGISTFVIFMEYNASLAKMVPSWAYYATGILTFTYQTLDAIDGKQARKTGTSSPLGQIFDHGCDVILATMVSFTMIGISQSGVGLLPFLAVAISTQLHQFVYMWWELHFRVFYASTSVIGVTEAQLGMIGLCFACGYFGPEFFVFDIFSLVNVKQFSFLPSTLNFQQMLLTSLIVMNGLLACSNIIQGLYTVKSKATAFGQMLGFGLFLYFEWLLYSTCLMQSQLPPALVYMAITTSYSVISVRLCVSSTCQRDFCPFQWPCVPFFVVTACLAAYGDAFYLSKVQLLTVLLCWNLFYLFELLFTLINDICRVLGLYCFTIKKSSAKST